MRDWRNYLEDLFQGKLTAPGLPRDISLFLPASSLLKPVRAILCNDSSRPPVPDSLCINTI